MKVHVELYSQLRDLAGVAELNVHLPADATVTDLLEKIYENAPSLRSCGKSILVGAGVEFVDRNYKLKAGDEISIMPPVQGG
jgi:molybdopterin converting factor small subunit